MTAVRIMLPEDVKNGVAQIASRRHIPFDKMVTIALMRELARVPDPELERRAARGRRSDFESVLAKIPDVPPPDDDTMD